MRFEMLPSQKSHDFDVVYRNQDHALISLPLQKGFGYSLSFNEVQIELSDTGLADHVWGYCPKKIWQVTEKEPPTAMPGELKVATDAPLTPGICVKISAERLPVYYNEHKQWLCFGSPLANDQFQIKLNSSLIAVFNPTRITAFWIRIDRFEK